MSDDEHPEPVDGIEFMDSEVQHVDYLLWSHGASNSLRARVKAEMQGETPPDWAVDPSDAFDQGLPSTPWLEQASLDDPMLIVREGGDRRFRVEVEETTGDDE